MTWLIVPIDSFIANTKSMAEDKAMRNAVINPKSAPAGINLQRQSNKVNVKWLLLELMHAVESEIYSTTLKEVPIPVVTVNLQNESMHDIGI